MIAKDFAKYYFSREKQTIYTLYPWGSRTFVPEERSEAVVKAVKWLLANQQLHRDNGFGSYYLTGGWFTSYPETSGYIIPTLIDYSHQYRVDLQENVVACADWLLSIQKPTGGWESGYVGDNRPSVVFNTGQVMRGLIATYAETGNEAYLKSVISGGDWLCSIQHEAGYWEKHTYLDMIRVYDTYVAAPLAQLYNLTCDEKYRDAAVRHCSWVITSRQRSNGWFDDCDNTKELNDSPITHTIAYTIDGLLEAGRLLNAEQFVDAAKTAADQLFAVFNKKKYLNARFNSDWKGTAQYICLTGCAQMAFVWLRLFESTKNIQYLNAAMKMNDFLIFCQCEIDDPNVSGAVPGSFPVWGDYVTYGYPNWAAKYFIDSLLLEQKLLAGL